MRGLKLSHINKGVPGDIPYYKLKEASRQYIIPSMHLAYQHLMIFVPNIISLMTVYIMYSSVYSTGRFSTLST